MNVHQIPARKDNYIYILDDPNLDHCAVIDATDFQKIKGYCDNHQKRLSAIFVTHHHEDHISAIRDLQKLYGCVVYGFKKDQHRIPDINHSVQDLDVVKYGPHDLTVFETPGHTLGHVSYYEPTNQRLFCGDVIFRFGCGRLFEGSPQMMLATLQKLRALPASTFVYCAHEYTMSNLEFCVDLEPENQELQKLQQELSSLRAQKKATVPFTLGEQKVLSPFLRWDDLSLKTTLGSSKMTDLETFTEVRKRRNEW